MLTGTRGFNKIIRNIVLGGLGCLTAQIALGDNCIASSNQFRINLSREQAITNLAGANELEIALTEEEETHADRIDLFVDDNPTISISKDEIQRAHVLEIEDQATGKHRYIRLLRRGIHVGVPGGGSNKQDVIVPPGRHKLHAYAWTNTNGCVNDVVDIEARNPAIWALVIGVEQYEKPPSDLDPLEYAASDAESMKNHLERLGVATDHIRMLPREDVKEVTRAAIIRDLDWITQKRAQEPDAIFFYYSGHGITTGDGCTQYLAGRRGNTQHPDEEMLPVPWIQERLNKSVASKKIIIIDACSSPGSSEDADRILASACKTKGALDLASWQPYSGSFVALSSEIGYPSREDPEHKHGMFTAFLLEAFDKVYTTGGVVTLKQAFDYARENVRVQSIKLFKKEQIPRRLHNADDGSMENFPISVASH